MNRTRLIALCLLLQSHQLQSQPLTEVVISAHRIALPKASEAGSWSNLDQQTLATVNPQHIQQALERLPGVNLHRNNGQEYLPAIRSPVLSGPGACGSVLTAEDGIPLRPAGLCNVNELFESHFEQARAIEVARGTAIALYGSNAMHGIVNVINPAQPGTGQQVALDFGPDHFQRLRTQLSNDKLALAYTASHDGGYRDDSGADLQKISLKYQAALTHIDITAGLTAINLNQETAGFLTSTDSYKDRSLAETNPNPEAYRDVWAMRGWVRFQDNADLPRWIIIPYARRNQMRFLQHFLPGQPEEENGHNSIGMQSAFYTYGGDSLLITGLDIELAEGWLTQYQASPTSGSPFLQATIPSGYHYDYQVDILQAAPFIRWQWNISQKLQATLGARFEWMRYDYDNRMLDGRTRDDGTTCGFGGCRYSRPADRTDTFNNWSPTAALQYQLSENHQLTFKLARGFRAPQATELYRLQREQQAADLDSEQLDSLEIIFRGNTGKARYEVVAYTMQKDNVIFRDSDFFTVSDGKTRHHGVEVALTIPLTETLQLSLSGSHALHRYDNHQQLSGMDIKNNRIDSAPRNFGSLQLRWQPEQAFSLEVDWQNMGSYYTDAENQHRYDGHDLLNLRSQWQLTKTMQLRLNLLNALDRKYARRADFTTFSGDRYFPGEPRALHASIQWQW